MTAYPELDQLELLHSEVRKRETEQGEEWDGLDRKATTVWSATGVAFGLVVTSAAGFSGTPGLTFAVFSMSLLVLVMGLLAGIWTLYSRQRVVVPKPETFVTRYFDRSRSETLAVLISTRVAAFGMNAGVSKAKEWRLRVQMSLFAIGVVGIVTSLVLRELKL
ncbi:MAG TPA: hypothetical protein VM328_13985 [Fimbriimonadaceae bacterium]|jgi:hypothetical protein|nr:hypothetical protein [Fimbriimonadaceae bacterium]